MSRSQSVDTLGATDGSSSSAGNTAGKPTDGTRRFKQSGPTLLRYLHSRHRISHRLGRPRAKTATMTIGSDRPGQDRPTLYGIFFEEINHAGDGGLYAEIDSQPLVRGRRPA